MTAFLFPGQGAQYPGMGKDFYEKSDVARKTFLEADDFLEQEFSKLIFEGPAEELTLTKNSQVAIFITSIAILRTVQGQFPKLRPQVCAGLSLGEYTALVAAKKIGFLEGLDLVRTRGAAMQRACEENPGTMQVVLGLKEEAAQEAIEELKGQVWIANLNCPGQIVIAGTLEGIALAAPLLKAKGAKRVLPLQVSGAFHSGLMLSAQKTLATKIEHTPFQESEIEIVMNVPGGYVSELQIIKNYLIDQVTQPVRWEKGVCAMRERGITSYIEMGPGKTLKGMLDRIGIVDPCTSIEKIDDLITLTEK